MAFGVADSIVFAISICIALGIGFFHGCFGKRQNSSIVYHLGNKKIKPLAILLSVVVTSQSSLTMIGVPVEAYLYGSIFGWATLGLAACFVLSGWILVPLLYPLNLVTVNEVRFISFKNSSLR